MTYLLLAGPTNAAPESTANGLFVNVASIDGAGGFWTADTIMVAVTDNGLPDNLSATNTFTIVVNRSGTVDP